MCNGNSSRAQNTKCHPNFHSEVAHAKMTALISPALHLIGLNTSNRKEKNWIEVWASKKTCITNFTKFWKGEVSLLVDLDVESLPYISVMIDDNQIFDHEKNEKLLDKDAYWSQWLDLHVQCSTNKQHRLSTEKFRFVCH